MALPFRPRLTIWYAGLLGLSLAACGTLLYLVLRANLERQRDESLRSRVTQLSRVVAVGPSGNLTAADVPAGLLGPQSLDEASSSEPAVQLLDAHAELIGGSGGALPIDPETVLAALGGRETLATLPLPGGRSIRLLTRPLVSSGRVVGIVQAGETGDRIETTLQEVRTILAAIGLAAMLIAAAGGWLLAGRALSPVRRVSALARRIAATDEYQERLPAERSRDEIGELVGTFNALIDRVESSLAEQRRFLADTSHELRSPLTVIRANLAFLWRETGVETRAEILRETEAEAMRMSRLVADLLLLGQGRDVELLRRDPVRLDELLQELAEQARVLADGRLIVADLGVPLSVRGDRDRLRQLLWNLIENALRYTPPDGTIRLTVRHEAGWAEVSVADTGTGIAPEHLPHLFERFYRVDRARSRATGGSGLGLAIVRHLAEAHGGAVSVESQVGRGSTFRVRLPLDSESPGALVSSQSVEPARLLEKV
jgi:heavy metal sensor kinase